MRDVEERKLLIDKASKKIVDDLEKVVDSLKDISTQPKLRDDFDVIHLRMLSVSETELELSYLYRSALSLKKEVDTNYARAKETLKDAQMEAVLKPTFKTPNAYSSRPETEGKLRSLTFEENFEVVQWERILADINYLIELIKSHQMDVNKQRRDIDTRLKIKGFQY